VNIQVGRTVTSEQDYELPLISVIIPTYNADKFIAEAIESVLAQTYKMFEIIVVDDGSTDKTTDILRKYHEKIQYIFQENRGPSAARNVGINIAQGEYICFLDADDLWTSDKLEAQLKYLNRHPEVVFVFSDHQDFKGEETGAGTFLSDKNAFEGMPFQEGLIQNAFKKLLQENFISTPTVMLKKGCFEKTGLFDEDLWSVEDRDLWIRMAAHFSLACLPKVLCKRRVHQSNISRQSELAFRSRIKVFEKNWSQFSHLAPEKIWHHELANDYCKIGYLLLEKNQRRQALHAALVSLTHAIRGMIPKRGLYSYPWSLGVGLIPAALLGWHRSRRIFRWMKNLSDSSWPNS